MNRYLVTVAFVALLAGCNGTQPFADEPDTGGEDGDGSGDGGGTGGGDPIVDDALDTGTVRPDPTGPAPVAADGILRLEARNDVGGGRLASVVYVPESDSFLVDGLGFDGENTYARGTAVGRFDNYNVFEADEQALDFLTGTPIGQVVPYRAIYGVSANTVDSGDPRTAFAIVRTGGYEGYGFGGFVYERNGSVTLPVSAPDAGQAIFTGDYAGIRTFDGRAGLEYTSGDAQIEIDFSDFNANDAVSGAITNRAAFDVNGNPIALGGSDDALVLPTINFVIQEGALNLRPNGELSGAVANSRIVDGQPQEYETGFYYGVIAGDMTAGDGGEIVGIVVVESDDPRFEGITAQETGGFILYRGDGN